MNNCYDAMDAGKCIGGTSDVRHDVCCLLVDNIGGACKVDDGFVRGKGTFPAIQMSSSLPSRFDLMSVCHLKPHDRQRQWMNLCLT